MSELLSLGLFVLLSLGCHGPLSPFLPATFEPILLLYGQRHDPVLVALLGGLTSVAAEYPNYYLYRRLLSCDSLSRVMRSNAASPVTALFGQHPFLAIWICAWSPLPDWSARILAAHSQYPVRQYLSAFLLGRIPKFWLIAQVGFYWMPGKWTVASLVAASALLTFVGALRHRLSSGYSRETPCPADLLSIPACTPKPRVLTFGLVQAASSIRGHRH